jgi:hypothetical protein
MKNLVTFGVNNPHISSLHNTVHSDVLFHTSIGYTTKSTQSL